MAGVIVLAVVARAAGPMKVALLALGASKATFIALRTPGLGVSAPRAARGVARSSLTWGAVPAKARLGTLAREHSMAAHDGSAIGA